MRRNSFGPACHRAGARDAGRGRRVYVGAQHPDTAKVETTCVLLLDQHLNVVRRKQQPRQRLQPS